MVVPEPRVQHTASHPENQALRNGNTYDKAPWAAWEKSHPHAICAKSGHRVMLPTAGLLQLQGGSLKPHCCLLLKAPLFQGFSFLEATQKAAQHKGMMELAGMTEKA